MGEIADALRRSQEREGKAQTRSQEPRREAPEAPKSFEAPRVSPPPAPPVAPPVPVDPVAPPIREHIASGDAAIADEGPEQEACRQIAVRLRGELESHGAKAVLVGSSLRGEGKTTASCNLALSLATISSGGRVALVDLDLRRPSVAMTLGIRPRAGIETVLAGESRVADACVSIDLPPIDVYPVKQPQTAAHALLSRERLNYLFDELESRYAFIVVDSPPTLLVPDSRMILERVPLFLPVVRSGTTRVRAYRAMLKALPANQMLAPLLNEVAQVRQYTTSYGYTEGESVPGAGSS